MEWWEWCCSKALHRKDEKCPRPLCVLAPRTSSWETGDSPFHLACAGAGEALHNTTIEDLAQQALGMAMQNSVVGCAGWACAAGAPNGALPLCLTLYSPCLSCARPQFVVRQGLQQHPQALTARWKLPNWWL